MLGRTVSEVQVNQALIGNPLPLRHLLEILYCILVQPYCYLLLELRGVWVGLRIREIVVITHGGTSHKLFFPALKTLVEMKEIAIDGFICPGHVSTIIGTKPYKKLKARQVIAGFEQKDVLMAIYMLLKQVFEKRFVVENEYVRAVNPEGNIVAYKSIFEVFEPSDGDWRGFGIIPKTGLKIKNKYSKFDAKKKYKNILNKIDFSRSQKPITRLSGRQTCICGEIIRGLKNPHQCSLFKKVCTPETPVGPCMVSCEGACNVEYRY